MSGTLSALLIVLGLNAGAVEDAGTKDGDLSRLQGRWTATAGQRKEIEVVLDIKGRDVRARIKTAQGLDIKVKGELKLDETTSPRSIDWTKLTGPDQRPLPEIPAVYRIDGDTFTVCSGGFLGARPREFKRGEGALADVVTFRRAEGAASKTAAKGQAPPAPSVKELAERPPSTTTK